MYLNSRTDTRKDAQMKNRNNYNGNIHWDMNHKNNKIPLRHKRALTLEGKLRIFFTILPIAILTTAIIISLLKQ